MHVACDDGAPAVALDPMFWDVSMLIDAANAAPPLPVVPAVDAATFDGASGAHFQLHNAASFGYCSPLAAAAAADHHRVCGHPVKQEDAAVDCGGYQLGLNLGYQPYFSAGDALAMERFLLRSKGLVFGALPGGYRFGLAGGGVARQHVPNCQVDDCKSNLAVAKHYHRRHRVCEFHAKEPAVAVGGKQQRFCQQCSRFHVLADFDELKRSCRKRLAEHNRRRRKPPPPEASRAAKKPNTGGGKLPVIAGKPTVDTSTVTTKSTVLSNASVSLQFKNAAPHPPLSLAGATGGGYPSPAFLINGYHQQLPFAVLVDDDQPPAQPLACRNGVDSGNSNNGSANMFAPAASTASSAALFHQHQSLFSSSTESNGNGGRDGDSSSSRQLNLGQATFELDFM